MYAEANRPTMPRLSPVTRWGLVAVPALITAFVLWFGWPAQAVELPAGAAQVEVYLIDDELTTAAAPGERDGWFARFSTPCDFDSWYVESGGTAMCAVLDGPHGTITVTTTNNRTELPAEARTAISRWVTESGPATRVLLVSDGEPAAIVATADPSTALPAR